MIKYMPERNYQHRRRLYLTVEILLYALITTGLVLMMLFLWLSTWFHKRIPVRL